MTEYMITGADVEAIASLHYATPQAKKDRDMTPILGMVKFVAEGDTWRAIATDRYMVAEVSGSLIVHESKAGDHAAVFLMDSKAWQALAKAFKGSGAVSFKLDAEAGRVEFTGQAGAQTHWLDSGNFPPVERLFPNADALAKEAEPVGNISLSPALLHDLGRVVSPSMVRDLKAAERAREPLHMRFSDNGYGKPGPVYITRPYEDYRALLQPNLLKK